METLFERLLRDVVIVLRKSSREAERDFILAFTEIDPEMAEEINNRLFVFDEIDVLDDEAVRKILGEIEINYLSKALKGAGPNVYEKILMNMSKQAAEQLKKDMEKLGPVKLDEVEMAQQKIIDVIRSLENRGKISVTRSTEAQN
jgi:flagellar motor switch protein FliG